MGKSRSCWFVVVVDTPYAVWIAQLFAVAAAIAITVGLTEFHGPLELSLLKGCTERIARATPAGFQMSYAGPNSAWNERAGRG
ncbi:MAG: hypothetical protein SGARI_003988 [Bacillariaceae sp.]